MLWEILLILLLILANGLFAAAEIAIIAARRGRLEQRAAEGSRNAQWALELSRDPDRFLPTVQIGITLVERVWRGLRRPADRRRSQRAGSRNCPGRSSQRHADGDRR